MGKLTETEKWEDEVYQIETSDPVLGGPDGVSNRPQKQLANRTQWLKKQLEEANNALAGHERSRNHPDATLTDRGFVKLYSGVASMDETMAATPKAVKIAMDNANARLAKERNLADLTNIPLARQSLQLGDSATRNVGTTSGTVAAGDDSRLLAFERTQSGLSAQGVMRISFADDLSHLPSGTRRFVINNTRARVLPTDDYCFLEVLAKRDTASGTAILLTDSTGNTWSGVRWNADTDSAFTWNPLIQTVSSLGLTDTVNRASHVGTDGNVNGSLWGGWLNGWLNNQLTARDNNINTRATWDYVNQTFIRDIRLGYSESNQVWRAWGYSDTPPYVITGVINGNTDDLIDTVVRRPLQKNINGTWYNISWI